MSRNSHQSVNGIIFNSEHTKILLIKRRDVPVWALPGGGLEAKETPEESVLRELHEETGCHVEIVRKIGEYTPLCRLAKFTHVYECLITKGQPKISDETADICFFSLNKLPKRLPPPYPDWIHDAQKNHATLLRKPISSVTYFVLVKSLIAHPILVLRFLLTKVGIYINSKI